MYGEENIISAVIHVDDNPSGYCDFVPLTKRGNLSAKDDRATKKCAGRKSRLLKQCKKGCLALNLHRLEFGSANLTLDQKLYEKMTASIKERGRQVATVKTTSKTKKLLENKEEQIEPA